MAGAVFDVFCLLLGDGMSRTDLLPPIRALFESSSRGVLVPFGVGFATCPSENSDSELQNSALTIQKVTLHEKTGPMAYVDR